MGVAACRFSVSESPFAVTPAWLRSSLVAGELFRLNAFALLASKNSYFLPESGSFGCEPGLMSVVVEVTVEVELEDATDEADELEVELNTPSLTGGIQAMINHVFGQELTFKLGVCSLLT